MTAKAWWKQEGYTPDSDNSIIASAALAGVIRPTLDDIGPLYPERPRKPWNPYDN